MEPGKSYYFQGIKFYIHNPENPLILMYRTKEFIVIKQDSIKQDSNLRISVHPYSTINRRVVAWIQNQIGNEDRIITPGGRTLSNDGSIIRNKTEFIYFVLNQDSNAVKIGKAKNITKRLNALQTGTPAKLKLLKIIDVKAGKEARETEQLFHAQFEHLRLIGEWFRYDEKLQKFLT